MSKQKLLKKLKFTQKRTFKREVVRIISPGTLTEDNLLQRKTNNFLGAISNFNGSICVAWVDVSTGCFKSRQIGKDNNSNQKQLLTNLCSGWIFQKY